MLNFFFTRISGNASRLHLTEAESLFETFSSVGNFTRSRKLIAKKIVARKITAIRKKALDFAQSVTLGNVVRLSAFR